MDGDFEPGEAQAAAAAGPGTGGDWVNADILRAIPGDDPAGSDPRLSETYEEIEGEVGKIGGVEQLEVDWARVERLAAALLSETSKDLRCACQWLVARAHVSGVDGLRQGVATLAALVEQFAGGLFPRRAKGRMAATDWLSEQLELAMRANALQLTRVQQDELSGGVARVQKVFETLELDAMHLESLAETFAQVKLVASEEEREEEVLRAFPEGYGELGLAILNRSAVPSGGDETGLSLRLRRWALWMAAPSGQGSQRDVTIAREDQEELDALCNGHRWSELLQRSEHLFTSTPFWLDLSYWSARAARQVIGEDAWLAIVGELRALLARDPNLVDAVDRDGRELASSEVRAWIDQEVTERGSGGGSSDASLTLPQDIQQLLEKGQLREAMLAAQGWIELAQGRVRFARCVTLANAFKELGATEQSFLVFRGLHGHLRSLTVKEWEPRLFAACIEGYLTSKKAASGLGPEDEPLLEELSVLDPTAVLGVLPA